MIKAEQEKKREERRKAMEAKGIKTTGPADPLRPWQTPSVVKAMDEQKKLQRIRKSLNKHGPHQFRSANRMWPGHPDFKKFDMAEFQRVKAMNLIRQSQGHKRVLSQESVRDYNTILVQESVRPQTRDPTRTNSTDMGKSIKLDGTVDFGKTYKLNGTIAKRNVNLNYRAGQQEEGADVMGVTVKRPNGQQSGALQRQMTSNKHQNFKDLKPIYDRLRYNRACDLAAMWVSKVGEKLVAKVKQEEIRIWNEELEAGKRLSYNQLRKLNTVFKREYIDVICKDDDRAAEYIATKQKEIHQKHDDVNHAIYALEDIQEDWDEGVEDINRAVARKMVEAGLEKKKLEKYEFMEFDIQDMYSLPDGTLCRACAKGLKCLKHQLIRMDEHLVSEDFKKFGGKI